MAFFHVIIPAAGVGSRMHNSVNQTDDSDSSNAAITLPKQYLPLAGIPIISHIIQVFFYNPRISQIHVALHREDIFWRGLTLNPASKLKLHYTGGETRAKTVLQTLRFLVSEHAIADDDWILVHDAARPGLTQQLLNLLIDSVENDAVGGLLALPVSDTLKLSGLQNRIEKTVSREHLWQAQTPQMFRFNLLKKALEASNGIPTDEAEAIEALGFKPKLVQGELRNLKITYPQDLAFLEAVFAADKVNEEMVNAEMLNAEKLNAKKSRN